MREADPLSDPLRYSRPAPPCTLVLFGANGDLAQRKLLPALYQLAFERRLPAGFAVLGVSRTPLTDDAFRAKMRNAVERFSERSPFDATFWDDFARGLFYEAGDILDPALYVRIADRLAAIERERQTAGNVLFYLSTQPSHYGPAAAGLQQAGLHQHGFHQRAQAWRRLVVEKPFGHDSASARSLDDQLHRAFPESGIYRIDHYLGKETVQNILAFRFGNGIFEPLWNRRYVNQVQITAAEEIGVEGRGAYYQEAGALRDMIQNHLLQVLATIAMEPPASYDAAAVRDERAKLLRSVRRLHPGDVATHAVAGQYGPSHAGGAAVPGFREEPGVDPRACTDTYAALTLFVDNWRWAGVPFYIRSGKRLPKRVTDIAIQFNTAPLALFENSGGGAPGVENSGGGAPGVRDSWPNLLVLRIQPEEGISLRFLAKNPGAGMKLRPVSMDFNYGSSFGAHAPAAYETLLLDALAGDATLYTRQDMIEASWAVVQPVLDVWAETAFDFPNYEAGSWGPDAADEMLARRGHRWRVP